jgi:hypothetical protein
MNSEIQRVLDAVGSSGKHKGSDETAYQLGVLAAWIARLANTDWSVRSELEVRLTNLKAKK